MKKRLLSLLLCLCMVLSMVPAALAEDTPETPEESAAVAKIGETTYATIAAALEAASEGDTIVLLKDTTENVVITKAVTLDLGGFTLTGDSTDSVMILKPASGSVAVQNGTVTGGKAELRGGGIYVNPNVTSKDTTCPTVTLENLTITGNAVGSGSSSDGGGVCVEKGVVDIKNCVITGNSAGNGGGGVRLNNSGYGFDSVVTLENCSVTNNTATCGGGLSAGASLYMYDNDEDGSSDKRTATFVLKNTKVDNNTTTSRYGGGVYLVGNGSRFTATGGSISGNSAKSDGGGIYCTSWCGLTLDGVTLSGNKASGSGGAVYVQNVGYLEVTSTENAVLDIKGGTSITGNTASQRGGGIFARSGETYGITVSVAEGCALYNNSASWGDDVYVYTRANYGRPAKDCVLKLPAATAMSGEKILTQTGAAIDNWYYDGCKNGTSTKDWSKTYQEVYTAPENNICSDDYALRAAHAYYTVTYTDGVEDAELFADQQSSVAAGLATPVFDGTPTRTGYTFKGWSPEVAEKVTGNATYTAQWEINKYNVTYTDGVDGEEVFADQTANVEYGTETPKFDGTPTRTGYTFKGWSPAVAEKVTENATYTAQWSINQHTLTYVTNGGSEVAAVTKDYGTEVDVNGETTKTGYTFTGWYTDEACTTKAAEKVTLNRDITVYAGWAVNSYTVSFNSKGGTEVASQTVKYEEKATEPAAPTREGFTFKGWTLEDKDYSFDTPVTRDITLIAVWESNPAPELEKGDHYAYIIGYTDGTVQPEGNITRAEVATIFFRLLTEETRAANLTDKNDFSDVPAGEWYNKAISTLAKMGIVEGYEGKFRPNDPITRAEFAAIAARFDKSGTTGESIFTDVPGSHWALGLINKAAALGWIKGDEEANTFRPDDNITRAEAMTFINRVLERAVDKDGVLSSMKTWSDNSDTGAWYYYDVQEATNSHDYERSDRSMKDRTAKAENWTKITANRDWTQYQ